MATTSDGGVPRPPQRNVTIADIARLAGVSVPTVSKVVNGRLEVAAATRAHVERVIHEHGYRRPNRSAVKPAASIELVFHELAGVYPVEIINGVEQMAGVHHLGVLVSESRGHRVPGRGWIDDVLARSPLGVIAVFSDLSAEQRDKLAARGIPLVVLDPVGVPSDDLPSVGATNWLGGLSVTRHLLDLGHRRIAAITGPAWALCSRARLDGYRTALEAAGIPVDPALIRNGEFEIVDGVTHTAQLLALEDPPTAIFAFNDGMAIGVYHAAAEAGVRIPHDLSVVGFDDYLIDTWLTPPLTTVYQPLTEMGASAARMILDLAQGIQPEHTRLELATRLVVRRSTAPPRR
ncbi:LacI family DNA-binding transcriptional regulator [Luedemannella helvata]|uniref:LacI family DNA-binding transcriptional regulator n=1 Tax=Luedemannella helvata TaxID=349315 RepID=A0ABN2L5G9_9ACTN